MHNNGTNRLILPGERQVLPVGHAPVEVNAMVLPQGVALVIDMGGKRHVVNMKPEEAANLGASLIGSSAVFLALGNLPKPSDQPENAEAPQD